MMKSLLAFLLLHCALAVNLRSEEQPKATVAETKPQDASQVSPAKKRKLFEKRKQRLLGDDDQDDDEYMGEYL